MPVPSTTTPIVRFAASLARTSSPRLASTSICGAFTASPLLMSPTASPDLGGGRPFRSPSLSFPTAQGGHFSPRLSVHDRPPTPAPFASRAQKSYFDIGLGLSMENEAEASVLGLGINTAAPRARIVSAPTRLDSSSLSSSRGLGLTLDLPAPSISISRVGTPFSECSTVRPTPAVTPSAGVWPASGPKVRIEGMKGRGALASPAIRKALVRRATPYPGKLQDDSYFGEREAGASEEEGPASFAHLRI